MAERKLVSRTRKFAYDVYWLVRKVTIDSINRQILQQLIDCSFSVSANYRSSQRGKSKRDSLNKIKIVLEEVDEANFWLHSIYDLKICDTDDCRKLIQESEELISIFVTIVNELNTPTIPKKERLPNRSRIPFESSSFNPSNLKT